MKTHRHRPERTTERPFSGPVSERENPRAHGGVCLVETCSCGAERRLNSNAGALERGKWHQEEA